MEEPDPPTGGRGPFVPAARRRRIALATAALVVIVGAAFGVRRRMRAPVREAHRLAAAASERRAAGDLEGAEGLLRRATELDPESGPARAAHAQALVELGREDGLVAVARLPRRGNAWIAPALAAANLHYGRGELDAARARIDEVLGAAPAFPAALQLRAAIALDAGRPRDAVRALTELAAAAGDEARTSAQAGLAGRALGRLVPHLGAALGAEVLLARAADAPEDLPAAGFASVALGRAPRPPLGDDAGGWTPVARALVVAARAEASGDGDTAEATLRDAFRGGPDPALRAALVRLLARQGRAAAARALLDAAPPEERAGLEWADADRATREAAQTGAAQDPWLAAGTSARGAPELPPDSRMRAALVRACGDTPDLDAALAATSPGALLGLDAPDVAARLRERADGVRGDPDAGAWHAAFALAAGEVETARAAARRVVAVRPRNAVARHVLALAHLAARRLDDAVTEARLARELEPDVAARAFAHAHVLVAAGRRDEAAALLRTLDACDGALADRAFAEVPEAASDRRRARRAAFDAADALGAGAAPELVVAAADRLESAGRPRTAVSVLRNAARGTGDERVARRLAESLLRAGLAREAAETLLPFAERAADAVTTLRLADALRRSGRTDEASAALRTAWDRAGDDTARAAIAHAQLAGGGAPADDVAAARAWLATEPAAVPAAQRALLAAWADVAAGELDAADRAAEALGGTPWDAEARFLRASVRLRSGRAEEALALLGDGGAAELPGEARTLAALARLDLAAAAERRGDAAGAARHAELALGGLATDALALGVLARTLPPREVVAAAQRVEDAHPGAALGAILRGAAAAHAGDAAGAETAYAEAAAVAPGSAAALLGRVVTAAEKDLPACADLCRDAPRAGCDPGAAAYLAACVAQRRGRAAEAAEGFRAAERTPAARRAAVLRRLAEATRGSADEGRRLADALGPEDAATLPAAARVLNALLVEEALASAGAWLRPLTGPPGVARDVAWARLLAAAGRTSEALAAAEAAAASEPGDAQACLLVAACAAELEHGGAAVERLLRSGPSSPAAWFAAGVAAERAADWELARKRYARAVELDPAHVAALNNLAWVGGERLGRVADALLVSERAAAAAPRDARVLDTHGRLLHRAGRTAEALEVLERACAAPDASAAVHAHRADALADLRRIAAAVAAYETALARGPDDALRARIEEAVRRLRPRR